jgi:hypothetical protein
VAIAAAASAAVAAGGGFSGGGGGSGYFSPPPPIGGYGGGGGSFVSSALTDVFIDKGVHQGDGLIAIFAPAVPEPSTWAMMLAGFTGLSAMALRRKRKVTPA